MPTLPDRWFLKATRFAGTHYGRDPPRFDTWAATSSYILLAELPVLLTRLDTS